MDPSNNERPHKRLLAGFEQFKAGDLEAARTTFAKIIKTNPNAVAAHLGLGRIYLQENDLQAAMQCCERALTHDPKSSRAKILMARVREALGDYDAAVRDYQDAVVIDPSASVAQRRLSAISAQSGNYEEAVDRLRTVLEHNPGQVAARLMLASVLERCGDTAAAKTELQRVLDLEPDRWIAAYRLAQLHLRAGETSEARPLLEKAVRLAPGNPAPRAALGAVLNEMGDHEAIAALARSKPPRENREMLAKEIETVLGSIAAAKRSAKKRQAPEFDGNSAASDIPRATGAPRQRRRQPRHRRKITGGSGEREGQEHQ
jgi:tetratricopeptide (TPR) repeat protein